MVINTDAFTATLLEGLRRDISRWKSELSMIDFEKGEHGPFLATSELRAWLEAGEEIFVRYERRER